MSLRVDVDRIIAILIELLNTPSPVGYAGEVMAVLRRELDALGLPDLALQETRKGALVATWPGTTDGPARALAGHVDTLGAMVREIKSNGRLMLTQLGGYAWNAIEGENVTVLALNSDRRYRGTVQTVHPSVHTNPKAREGERDDEHMEVRLDARTTKKEETQALGIDVGDYVCFDPRVEVTDTGFIKSRHLDDKAGVAVMIGALLTLADAGLRPARRTILFFSNYEEVGHGAAVGIPAEVEELLVIDMAASTTGEHQNSDEFSVGICAKDSSGPYDLALRQHLVGLCKTHDIPYRLDTYPSYGSDGSAFLRAGGDVRVGLIGPGVDASHGYERTHRDSLESTVRLAAHYILSE
jgi:putative aminopeptidase FrvX